MSDEETVNIKTSEEKPSLAVSTTASVTQPASQPTYSKALNLPATVGTRSRSTSPARLSMELTLKVTSQISRLTCLKEMVTSFPETHEDSSFEEHSALSAQVEELHNVFHKEHEYFESKWPASHINHEYFSTNVHAQELKVVSRLRRLLARLKQGLTTQRVDDETLRSRLPNLGLPTFSGEYEKWPQFKELFEARIINETLLASIEKLMYLRGCLKEAPAQLISNHSLTGESLETSWQALCSRYENKRLFIQSHLDQITSLSPLTSRSATGLNKLILTVSEAIKALHSLSDSPNMWDCVLVHHVSKLLDRQTREQWETSSGSSVEYPKFTQLETFITSALGLSSASKNQHRSAHKSLKRRNQRLLIKYLNREDPNSQINKAPQLQAINIASRWPLRNAYVSTAWAGTAFAYADQQLDASNAKHSITQCCTTPLKEQLSPLNKRRQILKHQPTSPYDSYNTLLATAVALIKTNIGTHRARLLIDPGSELTYIIEQLNIQRIHSTIPITGIGGIKAAHTRGAASVTLKSSYNNEEINLHTHILRTVTSILPSFDAQHQTWPHIRQLKLADPQFLKPRAIDIIIGADSYGQIIKPNIIKKSSTMPIAQLSIFGWLILGPVSVAHTSPRNTYHAQVQADDQLLQQLLTKFWIQEEPPITQAEELTQEEQECEAHFKATHSRDSEGRYIVRIPLKAPLNTLGNSYGTAHHCLQRTLKKLSTNCEYKQLYLEFLSEYEQLGHMVRAPAIKTEKTHYYLPHHGVLRPDKETTKLRVVFNGSSSTTTGLSLNDLMHTGPNLLLNITDVPIWIRCHQRIFSTDITKMYRQVKDHPDDWDLQRILWIDEHSQEVPYQLTTVTYGTKAAPYLACRALLQLGEDEGHRFPLAMPSLTNGRYVDDIFGGADTLEQLIEIARQLKELCTAGGFPLAKWHATHQDLLRSLTDATQTSTTISLDDCTSNLLELKWNSQDDEFIFSSKLSTPLGKLTKCIILSEVTQIFDPLGFLSPVIIRAKMLLQELWLVKLNWDDSLPPEISSRWLNIREELNSLAKI